MTFCLFLTIFFLFCFHSPVHLRPLKHGTVCDRLIFGKPGKIFLLKDVPNCALWAFQCALIVNTLPNDKNLNSIKLKAFADDKIDVAQKIISVFERVENIVEKGENAGSQHFLLSYNVFRVVKRLDCVVNRFIDIGTN